MNSYSEKAIKDSKNDKKIVQKNAKKKRKKQHLLFYKLVSFVLIILTVATFGLVIYKDFFDWQYLAIVGLVTFVIVFVITRILNKKKLRAWIKNIFTVIAILLQIFEVLVIVYGMTFLNFISTITDTGYRVESFGLYVINDRK